MLALALQYALFVFVAACGVLQISAARAGLRGLLVVPGSRAALALGSALAGGAFLWFFGLVDRNVRGLEGLEQTLLFVPSAVGAVVSTMIVSSLAHRLKAWRRPLPQVRPWPHLRRLQGLEALREMSYLDALLRRRERLLR